MKVINNIQNKKQNLIEANFVTTHELFYSNTRDKQNRQQ